MRYPITTLILISFFTLNAFSKVSINTTDYTELKKKSKAKAKLIGSDSSLVKSDSILEISNKVDTLNLDSALNDFENLAIKKAKETSYNYDMALVLSGGSFSSILFHIGVLKSIEKFKIPVDLVVASSWGSIVGALWTSGYSAEQIEHIFKKDSLFNSLLKQELEQNKKVMNVSKEVAENFAEQVYIMDNSISTAFGLKIERVDDNWKKVSYKDFYHSKLNLLSELNLNLKKYISSANYKARIPLKIAVSDSKTNKATFLEEGDLLRNISYSIPLSYSIDSLQYYNANIKAFLPVNELQEKFKPKSIIVSNASARKIDSEYRDNYEDIVRNLNVNQANEIKEKTNVINVQLYRDVDFSANYKYQEKFERLIAEGKASLREQAMIIAKNISRSQNYTEKKLDIKDEMDINIDLSFDEIPAETQKHLYVFWENANEKGKRKSTKEISKEIENSKLYADLEVESLLNQDSVEKITLRAKPRILSELYLGLMGQTKLGFGATAGVGIRFVNQLEFAIGIEGVYALNFHGFNTGFNISSNSQKGFFIDYKANVINKDNDQYYSDKYFYNPEVIYTTNFRKQKLNLGYNRGDSTMFYGSFGFDFSEYYTGTMADYNTMVLNDTTESFFFVSYYKDTPVRCLNFGITYSHNERRVDDFFLRDGYGVLFSETAVANAVPNMFQSSSDLYSRTRVATRVAKSHGLFSVSAKLDAGFDGKVEHGKIVSPDSLDLVAGKDQDPGLDRIYQNKISPSLYSQTYPMMEYYGHKYIMTSLSLGLNKDGLGLWVLPSYIYNPDGGDEIFNTPKNLFVIEALARFNFRSIELLAGVEQNSYNARSDGWGNLSNWRYYARIGKFDF